MEALNSIDGVSDCKVDFASKTATCKVTPGTDLTTLAKALEGTRFNAMVKN